MRYIWRSSWCIHIHTYIKPWDVNRVNVIVGTCIAWWNQIQYILLHHKRCIQAIGLLLFNQHMLLCLDRQADTSILLNFIESILGIIYKSEKKSVWLLLLFGHFRFSLTVSKANSLRCFLFFFLWCFFLTTSSWPASSSLGSTHIDGISEVGQNLIQSNEPLTKNSLLWVKHSLSTGKVEECSEIYFKSLLGRIWTPLIKQTKKHKQGGEWRERQRGGGGGC